jgi:hypothetical protein
MAPDLKTLYEFETNMENGFQTILTAPLGSITGNIYTQRQNVEKKSPRCELKFTLGSYTGHKGQDNAGVWRYDMWRFKLEATFITDRQENFAAHELMIGQTRACLEDVFTNVNLMPGTASASSGAPIPFYWICQLCESGTIPGFHSEDDTDQSQITFAGVFALRPGAWPPV